MKNELIALVLVIAVIAGVGFVFLSRKEEGAPPSGPSSGLSEEYFNIDRVYFENFVEFTGYISPHDFAVVVEITSGGRGVRTWSIGIDYGNGIGFQDNVVEGCPGGMPSPENNKIVIRHAVAKWVLPDGQHPKVGQQYHLKIHLTLTDNTYIVWEGNAGYL